MDSQSSIDDLMKEMRTNIHLKATYDLYMNTDGMTFNQFLIHATVMLARAYNQLLEDLVNGSSVATNSRRSWQEPILHDDGRSESPLPQSESERDPDS